MTITRSADGTKSAGGTGAISVNIDSIVSGYMALVGRAMWNDTATAAGEPGWTNTADLTGGTGTSVDAHTSRVRVDRRILNGSETSPMGWNQGGTVSGALGVCTEYSTDGTWDTVAVSTGTDDTHDTGRSVTGSTTISFQPGDVLVAFVSVDTNATTAWTDKTLAASGITFGGGTVTVHDSTTGGAAAGNDGNIMVLEATVTAGTDTVAPSLTLTGGPLNCGPVAFIRLRDIPPSTTPVSNDLDVRWTSYAQVAASVDLRWTNRAQVTNDVDLRWLSYVSVSQDSDLRWRVYVPVSQDVDLRWTSLAQVASTLTATWTSRAQVQSDLDLRWNSYVSVSSDSDLRWRSFAQVQQDTDLRWRVYVPVSTDIEIRWRVYEAVERALDLRWIVDSSLVSVSSDVTLLWNSYANVESALDLRWQSFVEVQADLGLTWYRFVAVAQDLEVQWRSYASVDSDVSLRWKVYEPVLSEVDLRWKVAPPGSVDYIQEEYVTIVIRSPAITVRTDQPTLRAVQKSPRVRVRT